MRQNFGCHFLGQSLLLSTTILNDKFYYHDNSKFPDTTVNYYTKHTIVLVSMLLFIAGKFSGPVTNTYLANSFLPNSFDGYI